MVEVNEVQKDVGEEGTKLSLSSSILFSCARACVCVSLCLCVCVPECLCFCVSVSACVYV